MVHRVTWDWLVGFSWCSAGDAAAVIVERCGSTLHVGSHATAITHSDPQHAPLPGCDELFPRQ